MKLKSILAAAGVAGAMFFSASAGATVLGNLNDGANHTSATTGFWSLFVNAGDFVTVTARRLDPVDIWGYATNGANGTGSQISWGDDQLSPYVGGPWGDPRFSFVAGSTGEYSIFIGRCCGSTQNEQIDYFVNATGATGSAVPVPGTLALLGLGLLGFGARRRKTAAQ